MTRIDTELAESAQIQFSQPSSMGPICLRPMKNRDFDSGESGCHPMPRKLFSAKTRGGLLDQIPDTASLPVLCRTSLLKQRLKSVESVASDDAKTRGIVSAMLEKILAEGCSAVEAHSKQLDGYEGSIVVTAEEMEEASNTLDPQLKEDIEYAHRQITLFAQAQRDSISDFELEISPGVFAGQRLIPMSCAGCYVPGGICSCCFGYHVNCYG